MNKFGAKLLTATIKNPLKKELVYRMLMDYTTAYRVMEQNNVAEKLLYYKHHYLTKPNPIVIQMSGGLGNQMSLYAFGKTLESNGYSVIFDGGHYKNTNYGGG